MHHGVVIAVRRRRQARRCEDVGLHVVGEPFARESLHDRDEQLESGDRPVPLGAGLVHPVLAGVERHHFVERLGQAAGRLDRIAEVVVVDDAGSVVEQLPDGDVVPLHRKLGDELRDVVVERELAALDQLHHGDAGEREHRPDDVIDGLVLRRRIEAQVGESVSPFQKNPILVLHQHRSAHHGPPAEDPSGDRTQPARKPFLLGGRGPGERTPDGANPRRGFRLRGPSQAGGVTRPPKIQFWGFLLFCVAPPFPGGYSAAPKAQPSGSPSMTAPRHRGPHAPAGQRRRLVSAG